MAMHVVPEISMHRDGRPCLISCLLLAQWCTNRQNFNKLLILDHATHTQPNPTNRLLAKPAMLGSTSKNPLCPSPYGPGIHTNFP